MTKNKIENQPFIQKWIPCSERLPMYGEVVLCSCTNGGITVSCITYKGVKKSKIVSFGQHSVVAWMPLPEGYSENSKKSMTNADRIRNMTDEELAETIDLIEQCKGAILKDCDGLDCIECTGCFENTLAWLKENVKTQTLVSSL